jgi:hypothetical protein
VTPTGTAEQQILAQYRRFWTETYPRVFAAPTAERRDILRPVVAERLLSELLRIAGELDGEGKWQRGTPAVLGPAVTRQGGLAVVSDCVDMTGVKVVDRSTGQVTYDPPDRKPTESYLRRGADGAWRVYALKDIREYEC